MSSCLFYLAQRFACVRCILTGGVIRCVMNDGPATQLSSQTQKPVGFSRACFSLFHALESDVLSQKHREMFRETLRWGLYPDSSFFAVGPGSSDTGWGASLTQACRSCTNCGVQFESLVYSESCCIIVYHYRITFYHILS